MALDTRSPNLVLPLDTMEMYQVVKPTRYEATLLMGQTEKRREWIEVPAHWAAPEAAEPEARRHNVNGVAGKVEYLV